MAIGAILSAIGSVASPAWNAFTTLKGWQRDDKATSRMYAREDNAVQRRVADLKSAGLSPVLAAGSAATTMQPVTNSSHANDIGNPIEAYLGTVQQRKNIDSTVAGTQLTKLQQQTEAFKKIFMTGQLNEIDERIKNMQSERAGIDLRNSWINADMSSQLKLRDGQLAHLAKDTLRIGQQTELLKAQTAYEQTAIDKLIADTDNAKILRDMNLIDRSWRYRYNMANTWNLWTSGGVLKNLLGGLGATGMNLGVELENVLKGNPDPNSDWYYPKR